MAWASCCRECRPAVHPWSGSAPQRSTCFPFTARRPRFRKCPSDLAWIYQVNTGKTPPGRREGEGGHYIKQVATHLTPKTAMLSSANALKAFQRAYQRTAIHRQFIRPGSTALLNREFICRTKWIILIDCVHQHHHHLSACDALLLLLFNQTYATVQLSVRERSRVAPLWLNIGVHWIR